MKSIVKSDSAFHDPITTEATMQKIMDAVGAVQGVKYALLVTPAGTPLIVANSAFLPEPHTTDVCALIANLESILRQLRVHFELGPNLDYLYFQSPQGLGIVSPIKTPEPLNLVLITHPTLKLSLLNYLVSATKDKLLNLSN